MAGGRWQETGAALAVVSALAMVLFHAGTFHRGATAFSLAAGAALLLAFAFLGHGSFLDPLALRRDGSPWWPALLGALWFSVLASWIQSPVGRAGEAIVLFLLPATWAAAGIGRFLGSDAAVRRALAGCAVVGVSAATWALAMRPLHEQGRAALPIGHHNQLALVLVAILPPAVLGAWRVAGPDRRRWGQGAALFVGAVLVWTLAATGSMSGLAALLVQAVGAAAWILWRSKGRRVLVPLAALLALVAGLALSTAWAGSRLDIPGPIGRLGAILRLEDPSLLARRTYAEAAAAGFAERSLLGWGPGSTSWTLANHWRPAPGVHPPGEVVTDAHSLLAQVPYELGVAGSALMLLLVARYGRVRLGELGDPRVRDPVLLAAALLGLMGAGVCLAFGVFAVVTAVPAVLILNLGLAAAASCRTLGAPASSPASEGGAAAKRRPPARWRQGLRIAFYLWLVAAAAWTWQRTSAARAYEVVMATKMADPAAASRAAARDPSFPLYHLRLDPWTAAAAADGLAPLWLLAGVDQTVDVDRRRQALERACDLDPLSALAPFELMRVEREAGMAATDPRVAVRAARAILAEPLLLAAAAFEGDPDLRAELHRQIQSWPGLPPGWLAAFEELWFGLDWSNGHEGPPRDVLSVDADGRPAVSFSLFAFRRQPWPLSIGAVPLRSHRLDFVAARDLPAVTRLPETAPEPFWIRRCGVE
ncbi:MAG: O-antigen ligase family protein [Acidobacteriota bacterium]|nr:O-antigen ligase family protein [Acidobacteriota bacterium]MDE3264514.1 O-antigen ligase family protein [Acidobacteriota bacterium]